ncbi:MAG: phosphocholine cytidylyltransferase family protein [Candidatus Cloacimonetes bacterium]|nr:phosphocholine cytidylyltransferase family protein [Candidatus Cloacimonadota bacterium]MCF7868569.1 phosphocholine cytidylyltransferase family protein [Candidatus Cloacimonadota bacterium]MCF7884281.1 phosphocholine cytidylyltransferase family protein [Candidatus Cloacimonadota bacterium]
MKEKNIKLPAVILAAGKGTRLGKLSDNKPKPMTEVNGRMIIENLIESLIKNGFERIIVATGYLNEILEETVHKYQDQAEIICVYNEIYGSTNNIYSLWLTKKYLRDGFYLFEADVFFEDKIMKELVEINAKNVMLVGKHNNLMDGTVVDLKEDNSVLNMYLKRHQKEDFDFSNKYKTVNFYRISEKFAQDFFLPKMDEHIEREDWNSYYELIIKEALDKRIEFFAVKTEKLKWWEIDTIEDLEYCEKLFS